MAPPYGVDVVVTRFVLDHQPNIVAWRLTDIYGRDWEFEDKSVYVTSDYLDADSDYPRPGELGCVMMEKRVDDYGEVFYRINTGALESLDEVNIFDVRFVRPVSS